MVAIHGIGNQLRGDSIRSVADRFGSLSATRLPVMPLGFFHIENRDEVSLRTLIAPADHPAHDIQFTEVFWADIPRDVVRAEDTLEETKAWGRSIVSRTRATYENCVTGERHLKADDFDLAATVVEEVVESVAVMERLLTVADKAGIFKFDLGPLMRDYIGDVQLVTDFEAYRNKIVHRFQDAMARIAKSCKGKPLEIYIVAHSEGSVVTFLGLLEALSNEEEHPWIKSVRGFMTIGSPIDKHIVLWEGLWKGLAPKRGYDGGKLRPQIRWRNYYDYGDPIGFKLDSAETLLTRMNCDAFDFKSDQHNFGFSRYWLPGKAHVDYWTDDDVFEHFIRDVVLRKPEPTEHKPPEPPTSKPWALFVNTSIPYAVVVLLHVLAVFVLAKALADGASVLDEKMVRLVAGVSPLVVSITVAARIPRLVRTEGLWRWRLLVLGVFAVAAALAWLCLPDELAYFVADLFIELPGDTAASVGKAMIIAGCVGVTVVGWFTWRDARVARRAMLICGGLTTLVIVAIRVAIYDLKIWPVLLASAAFLYLWWIAVLLFDLSFIWHRYIRHSVGAETLQHWYREQKDVEPSDVKTMWEHGVEEIKQAMRPATKKEEKKDDPPTATEPPTPSPPPSTTP